MKPASEVLEISKTALRSEYDRIMAELTEDAESSASRGRTKTCLILRSPSPEVVIGVVSTLEGLGYEVSTDSAGDAIRINVSWGNIV